MLVLAMDIEELRRHLGQPSEDFRREFLALHASLGAAVEDLERLAFGIYRSSRRLTED
jgi:hypothetical protein